MTFQHLEINKLATDGSVVRKIRALPGRVTVFRSQIEGENDRYKAALEGKVQSDRFSILLDGVAFRPQDHLFIGCGPLDEAPAHETVSNFLARFGIEQVQIEATLMKYGLGGLAHQKCSELTSQQWETLRVIGYTSTQGPKKVLILNDPFVNLPDTFRDKIAERLATFSWESQAIVVVTKLSYRPQSWIENDYIARVQLEKPRQATIGFGGGEFSNAAQIEQLRKDLGITTASGKEGSSKGGLRKQSFTDLLSATGEVSSKIPKWARSPAPLGAALVILVMVTYTGFTIWNSRSSVPQVLQASVINPQGSEAATQLSGGDNGSVSRGDNLSNSPSVKPSVKTPVFAQFPEEIKVAWVNAATTAKISPSYNGNNVQPASEQIEVTRLKTNSPLQPLYDELTSR